MEIVTKSLKETKDLSAKILSILPVGYEKGATILALYGDLGSGKTTFTQFLAGELGVKDHVTSPTFVIMKKYPLSGEKKFKQLIHIDCYRFDEPVEILNLGWEDMIADENNLIVVEWPEKITPVLPDHVVKMEFEFVDEDTRRVKVEN